MEGIKIRRMLQDDLREVQAIENQCFTTPWTQGSFKYELKNRETILNVSVLNNQIIGYVCLRTILDATHILNLAVSPRFRRTGIGSMLLRDALDELKRSKPDTKLITLEVRESNAAAINIYEKFGFKITGKRIGYYQKPHEDAVIMELKMR